MNAPPQHMFLECDVTILCSVNCTYHKIQGLSLLNRRVKLGGVISSKQRYDASVLT